MNDQELFARFMKLTACQASDGMDRIGLPRRGLTGIHGMEPVKKVIGRACTVRFVSFAEGKGRAIEYLADVKPGQILVLANNGRLDCSSWGGQRTTGAMQKGAVGAVVDGAYRDVDEHRALGFPVYGRASSTMGSSGQVVPVEVNIDVMMCGVPVSAGDVIYGDVSGVVAIPADKAEAVLLAAEGAKAEETRISQAVKDGVEFVNFRAAVREGTV